VFMKIKYFILLFSIFLIRTFAIAQKQTYFRQLSVEQGLSQNSVVNIAQDSIGYLWFATQDGLNRYDGRKFEYFNKQFDDITKPNYSKLGKIFIDKEHKFWVIVSSGRLEKYNKKSKRLEHIKRFESVSSIFQDNQLNLYIGTHGKGIFKIDYSTKDTLQVFKQKDFNKNIYDFIQVDTSVLVASTNSVFSLINNTYKSLKIEGNPKINFSAFAKTNDDKIWLGTFGKGLYYKPSKKNDFIQFKVLNNKKLPTNLNIQDLLVDKHNRLWIATYGQGAYLLDFQSETLQHFKANRTNPYALNYNDVLCLYEDYTGTIWLGTDGAGLSYYDEHLTKFNVLTNDQSPTNVNVDVTRAIAVDLNDVMWLGTSGKGLTKVDLKTQAFKTFTKENSTLSSNRVMSLLFHDNELWIGHQSEGLNILEPSGKFRNFDRLSNLTIWKIYKDSKQRIWLCTRDNGLIMFDKRKGVLLQLNKYNSELTTNNIRTIEQGERNILWIGTDDNGLFKFNFLTKKIDKIEQVSAKIKSLYYTKNTIWVGTNGDGLQSYNSLDNTLKKYTKNDGLPNQVIYGILPDDKMNLWLSSNRGITKFYVDRNNKPIIKNYNSDDGLQTFEFNTGAYFKSTKEVLYFGGLKGVNWFKPSQITFNQSKPKTTLSKVEVFNKSQNIIEGQKFLYNKNTFTFTFASMHFSQPERNLYKYRLTNHDTNWIFSGNNNTAHYTNLPPNDYEFRVISSNYDNVWNDTPVVYSFTILKPWYLTNVAKIIYAILCIILIFSIYKYFKWRWKVKVQLRIEHMKTARFKKIDELKTKFYTNISHEFRTPLTLISGSIQQQLKKSDLKNEERTNFEMANRNSTRLLSLIDQLLDISKIETGNFKLKVCKRDVMQFIGVLTDGFTYMAKQKEINYIIYTNSTTVETWFNKDTLEKIIVNLLSNAIKYTPIRGSIICNTLVKENQLYIEVKNTGKGLLKEELTKIFDRFYQTDENKQGVGIGLSLVKELVNLHKGTITVVSKPNEWTTFKVVLPINKTSFKENEFDNVSSDEFSKEQPFYHGVSEANIDEKVLNDFDTDKPILLIVDDNADIRAYISNLFKDEYTIYLGKNGQEGIDLAIKHVPDIIISDIIMPVKNGIELCNCLKSDERTSHIPIVLLTAKAGEENEIEGVKTGADVYITKPFNEDLLQLKVTKLLESRKKLQLRYSQEVILKPKDIAITSVDEQFLERLQKVLDEKLVESSYSIDNFSKAVGMSRMQLHRKLKALTGLSTTEFIRSQRLKLAAQLLKKSEINVSQVGYSVGFNDHAYFSKCFKEMYQCSPTEYVNNTK